MTPLMYKCAVLDEIRSKPKSYEEIRTEISDEDFFRYHYLPFVMMEVFYDYVDSMLNQAAYLRISALKKICRALKEQHAEFNYFKKVNLDWNNRNQYTEHMEWFQDESIKEFTAEFLLIKSKISNTRSSLALEWRDFVATVYMCLIFYDALRSYCRIADEKIEKVWNKTNLHSIMTDDVMRCYPLIKVCLGDCDVLSKDDMKSSSKRILEIIKSVTFEGNLERD